jgi:DamX protein
VRDGETWYVVVYGSYRDRTKAKAAISGLPVALRELKPWVRQVGDLQAVAAP